MVLPATLFERLGATDIPSAQAQKMIDRATPFAAALNHSPAERAKVVRSLIEKVMVEEKRLTIKVPLLLGRDVPSSASEDRSDRAIELTGRDNFRHPTPRWRHADQG